MKKSFPLYFFALIVSLLLIPAAFCGAETIAEYPEEIAARLQQNYDAMQSLSFSFSQESRASIGGRPRTGSGTAVFYKSDDTSRMRWDYAAPERQVLISDGDIFSMYFEELQQLIITPASSLDNDLLYAFFAGRARIESSFHILPAEDIYTTQPESDEALQIIKLVPREPQSQMQSIHLFVSRDSRIQRLIIQDHFDTITTMEMSNIEIDTLVATEPADIKKIFAFTPPEGTEIIRQ